MEEFELHPFTSNLVPENHKWKEFHEDGTMKTALEKAR